MRHKVSIIGAGQTGSSTALWLAARNLCDIVLLDVVSGLAQGKAMDMQEAMPILGQSTSIRGTCEYVDTANSDIIVITAGSPRKKGMSRDDLLQTNAAAVAEAVEKSLSHSPGAMLIVLTNPVDALAYLAYRISGLPKNRVLGQGGILDSARLRILLAEELGVSVESVHTIVLGEHGDGMVPMLRHSNVCGVPLADLLPMEKLKGLVERVRNRGAEIISLLRIGSAAFAPGAALTEMIEAVLDDTHSVLPCSAYCDGEFGLHGLYFGVPVQIGRAGMERIVEIPLNAEEQSALKASATKVRRSLSALSAYFK
jgi:malate dehydrogenase